MDKVCYKLVYDLIDRTIEGSYCVDGLRANWIAAREHFRYIRKGGGDSQTDKREDLAYKRYLARLHEINQFRA